MIDTSHTLSPRDISWGYLVPITQQWPFLKHRHDNALLPEVTFLTKEATEACLLQMLGAVTHWTAPEQPWFTAWSFSVTKLWTRGLRYVFTNSSNASANKVGKKAGMAQTSPQNSEGSHLKERHHTLYEEYEKCLAHYVSSAVRLAIFNKCIKQMQPGASSKCYSKIPRSSDVCPAFPGGAAAHTDVNQLSQVTYCS